MSKNNDTEPTSGFTTPAGIVKTDGFTEFTSIPNRGVFQLTRAKRHGRWWLLKGLQDKYQEDSIYRVFLEKEFEITSQLQHPMVVSVYSLEEVKGLGLCIVMEWIEGMTLREWLAAGGHTRKQRRHIANMLLEALIYVHSRQTQHRDLKPSNMMVTHNGQYLKLIDFGLSDTDSHAVLKVPAGTKGYMAPEGPSDIYSLGVILRELHLGWTSCCVARKCCAPLRRRYHDISTIQRDLQRAWHWPRRIIYVVGMGLLVAVFYLFNLSGTQQKLQSVNDSLKIVREENNNMIKAQRAKSDSLELQMNQMNQESRSVQQTEPPSEQLTESQTELLAEYQAEQEAKRQHEQYILEEKRRIDHQIKELGFEQILDTLTCRFYFTPTHFLKIIDDMKEKVEEPELKEYIEEHYRKPYMKRYYSLPLI